MSCAAAASIWSRRYVSHGLALLDLLLPGHPAPLRQGVRRARRLSADTTTSPRLNSQSRDEPSRHPGRMPMVGLTAPCAAMLEAALDRRRRRERPPRLLRLAADHRGAAQPGPRARPPGPPQVRPTVADRPCLPSLADVPEPVDLVLLGVPDHALVEQVRAASARGDGGAVVFGSAHGQREPDMSRGGRRARDLRRRLHGLRATRPRACAPSATSSATRCRRDRSR